MKTQTSILKTGEMRMTENRNSAIDNGAPTMSDKVAQKIAWTLIEVQKRFAYKMNNAFQTMNIKRLKIALLLFCFVAGGVSLYLIVNALTTHPKANDSLRVEQANIPKHFDKTGEEIIEFESYVDEHTYGQIPVFKTYMDSLKNAESPLFDSIVLARPYLMDSIQALEQLYYSQTQK